MLQRLCMQEFNLETIEHDVFSNLKLYYLDLTGNCINYIGKNAFLNLKNLETLYLSGYQLTSLDRGYIGIGNSVKCRIFL